MPYKNEQAKAIFLEIKRKKGLAAAKQFANKHPEDFHPYPEGRQRPYRPKKRRK